MKHFMYLVFNYLYTKCKRNRHK